MSLIEPFTINDMHFKGARILYSHLSEGLEYVKKHRVKEICIRKGFDDTRYLVDFDFLRELTFVETFEFIVNLSKKSDLEGLYSLSNLREFRWVVNNVFDLDFSRLATIEKINTRYYDGIKLENLTSLKELYLNSVKTDSLEFLPAFENLELLRIIGGKFTTLAGLERCKNLKKLDLRRCFNLCCVDTILQKLNKLESVTFDSCKKIDINLEELKKRVPHVWVG